jgi:hypothetical protein
MPQEALEIMNREWPAFEAEMAPRGVQVFGRELDFPETGVTVRVRNGETLVTDGPFVETKEWVAGIEMLECSDLDEVIEVTSKNPVARFNPFEIRPLREEPILSEGVTAFARHDVAAGAPFLMILWVSGGSDVPIDESALADHRSWAADRDDLSVAAVLDVPRTARTVRYRDGAIQVSDGPLVDIDDLIASIDVVACRDRQQEVEIAATHPFVRRHAIEVRPFEPTGM